MRSRLFWSARSIYGSLTGTPIDNEDTLAFSVLENIRPMIETVPSRTGYRCLRSHDAGQSAVPLGFGYEKRSRTKGAECIVNEETRLTFA
jgi:hypothetical protein